MKTSITRVKTLNLEWIKYGNQKDTTDHQQGYTKRNFCPLKASDDQIINPALIYQHQEVSML